MTVLENWQYGDPEYVAMRKEEDELRKARACGECMHRKSMEFRGDERENLRNRVFLLTWAPAGIGCRTCLRGILKALGNWYQTITN